jgi:hypothetical protein
MDKETAEALEKSIKHWEENLEQLIYNKKNNRGLIENINIFTSGCALCQMFYNKKVDDEGYCCGCYGCPVAEYTGENNCEESPWEDVRDWWNYDGVYEQGVEVITKQIEFLKSLRNN